MSRFALLNGNLTQKRAIEIAEEMKASGMKLTTYQLDDIANARDALNRQTLTK